MKIPPGTLDVLILKTLARAKQLHGFEIANTIQTMSENILQVGAKRASVLFMVVKQVALLAVVGVAIGVVGAVFLTRFLSSLLAGVRTTNPFIYTLVSVLLLFVALLASYLPARRASKIDPLVALRYE